MKTTRRLIFSGIKPPSINNCYRTASSKCKKISPRKQFDDDIKKVCKDLDLKPTNDLLSVEIYFEFKGSYNPDIDNVCRCIINSLQGIVYHNDRQIMSLYLNKKLNAPKNKISFYWTEHEDDDLFI